MKRSDINHFWAGSLMGSFILSGYYFAEMVDPTNMPHNLVLLVMTFIPIGSLVLTFTVNRIFTKKEG